MEEKLREMLSGSEGAALRELLQGVLRTPEGKKLAEQIADAAKRQSETK